MLPASLSSRPLVVACPWYTHPAASQPNSARPAVLRVCALWKDGTPMQLDPLRLFDQESNAMEAAHPMREFAAAPQNCSGPRWRISLRKTRRFESPRLLRLRKNSQNPRVSKGQGFSHADNFNKFSGLQPPYSGPKARTIPAWSSAPGNPGKKNSKGQRPDPCARKPANGQNPSQLNNPPRIMPESWPDVTQVYSGRNRPRKNSRGPRVFERARLHPCR
jgi:hypothetical protein